MQAVRSVRVGKVAVLDYALTILVAVYWARHSNIPLPVTTIVVLLVAIGVHAVLKVPTPTGVWLGIDVPQQ